MSAWRRLRHRNFLYAFESFVGLGGFWVPLCVMAEVGIRCGQLLVGSVGWKLLAFSAEARQGAACFVKQSHAELTAVEWHQGRSRLSGRGADCLTSHAHRQHTVSLFAVSRGQGCCSGLGEF